MAQNLLLSYDGVSPSQALLGVPPRDLYETDSSTLDSSIGSVSSTPDAMDCALRLRMMAKGATIQSIIEDRIARANNTRSQQVNTSELKVGSKAIDIYRMPDSRRHTLGKGDTGWHGPADLLEIPPDNSKAAVVWQDMPLLLPSRHIRKHIGYLKQLHVYHNHSNKSQNQATLQYLLINSLQQFMDTIDGQTLGKLHLQGKQYSHEGHLHYTSTIRIL